MWPHAMLRIGGQVRLDTHAFRQARSHYARYRIRNDMSAAIVDNFNPSDRELMEDQVADVLREAYRSQWTLPLPAQIMATCPQYMLRGAGDIAPDCGSRQCAADPWFVSAALRVAREYQQSLWDHNNSLRWQHNGRGKLRDDRSVWSNSISANVQDKNEGFFFTRFGHVGVFFTDLRSNRLDLGGFAHPDRPLIGERQWAALESATQSGNMTTLVICSELPFVYDSPHESRTKQQMDPQNSRLQQAWSSNKDALLRLLTMSFEWQSMSDHVDQGERTVLLIAAGYNVAMETAVKDLRSGETIQQLLIKPFHPQFLNEGCSANEPSSFVCEPKGCIGTMYTFKHTIVKPQGSSFLAVTAVNSKRENKVAAIFKGTNVEDTAVAELEAGRVT